MYSLFTAPSELMTSINITSHAFLHLFDILASFIFAFAFEEGAKTCGADAGGCAFCCLSIFLDSLYYPKDPIIGICFLFFPPAIGFELDLSKWIVLPDFSTKVKYGVTRICSFVLLTRKVGKRPQLLLPSL